MMSAYSQNTTNFPIPTRRLSLFNDFKRLPKTNGRIYAVRASCQNTTSFPLPALTTQSMGTLIYYLCLPSQCSRNLPQACKKGRRQKHHNFYYNERCHDPPNLGNSLECHYNNMTVFGHLQCNCLLVSRAKNLTTLRNVHSLKCCYNRIRKCFVQSMLCSRCIALEFAQNRSQL